MRVIVARSNSFIPSKCKKAKPTPKGEVPFQEVSDASPSWRDSGHSKGYLHFSPFPTETAERKSSKKCGNVINPPIIMVVRKAFFDVGHPLKYQSKNRRKLDGKFMAVYLRIDDVLMKRLSL
jgi:hypothetical protein